eukprot:GHVT01026294.1.p1 GENE.GHVT01026294.1~~GHVT01026294.1.p1  ORF type:complete len:653 (+),score=121.60 GHVT01026294.1:192-1961(+)
MAPPEDGPDGKAIEAKGETAAVGVAAEASPGSQQSNSSLCKDASMEVDDHFGHPPLLTSGINETAATPPSQRSHTVTNCLKSSSQSEVALSCFPARAQVNAATAADGAVGSARKMASLPSACLESDVASSPSTSVPGSSPLFPPVALLTASTLGSKCGGSQERPPPHGSESAPPFVLQEEMNDFITALGRVQPTACREGFAAPPSSSFDDIGALSDLRKEMEERIIRPIKEAALYARLNLQVPAGCLFYGPPGCGKTLLAKAVAKESGANFIAVKGPELLNKYVGESERAVRSVFERASACSPCVIFFDEFDALCPRRGGVDGPSSASSASSSSSSSSSAVTERVVNQLLTELDGVTERRHVFVIAATNRPDIVDPAMLRPGRVDKLFYVPLPDLRGRTDILRAITTKTPMHQDVDLQEIANAPRAHGLSGADLAGLVREATLCALSAAREAMEATHSSGEAYGERLVQLHTVESPCHPLPSVPNQSSEFNATVKAQLPTSSSMHPLPSSSSHLPYPPTSRPTSSSGPPLLGTSTGSGSTPGHKERLSALEVLVTRGDFFRALSKLRPSVSPQQAKFYEGLRKLYEHDY